jgi:hypothetical protein
MFDAPDEELHGLLATQDVDRAGLDFSAVFMNVHEKDFLSSAI